MKAAIIGCGRMGAFASDTMRRYGPSCWFPLSHAEAIQAHPDLQLSAICDQNPDILSRAADVYGPIAQFADYRDMLAVTQPDLVCIATRTPGRRELIAECLDAGVRALHCEKPLCNSTEELNDLSDRVSRDDVYVTLGAIRRHMKIYKEAVKLAESGEFGKLVEIRINLGSGALYWTHPHSVDLALMAAGQRRVRNAQAVLGSVTMSSDTPNQILNDPLVMHASIWFEDGTAAHIGRTPGHDVQIACENGVIEVRGNGSNLVLTSSEAGDPYFGSRVMQSDWGSEPQGTYGAIDQLVGCLRGQDSARKDNQKVKRDIVMGQEVLFALARSHLSNSGLVSLERGNEQLSIMGQTDNFFA